MEENKGAVLLAEDEFPVRKYIAELLSHHGFRVLEAEDGREGIRLYEENRDSLNAIVADMRMPNVSGSEFARFNYENRFIPFVVCTAMADAKASLELLGFGVQDYVVKPIDEPTFVNVVKNAFMRRRIKAYVEDDANPYAGNVGSITVSSRLSEITRVNRWIGGKLKERMGPNDLDKFMNFLQEFLVNAHEHGNLRIDEDEKSDLINAGRYEEELMERESACKAKIKVDLSVLKNEVAVSVTDDGFGFKYEKYVRMSDETLVNNLSRPNGRGIFMANRYFDSVFYSKGGASVMAVKKIPPGADGR